MLLVLLSESSLMISLNLLTVLMPLPRDISCGFRMYLFFPLFIRDRPLEFILLRVELILFIKFKSNGVNSVILSNVVLVSSLFLINNLDKYVKG